MIAALATPALSSEADFKRLIRSAPLAVLAYGVELDDDGSFSIEPTPHRWLSESKILSSPDVCEFTKDYFRPRRRTHHAAM